MDTKLMVVQPFGSYAKGDVVSDPGEVMKILACENASKVVRISMPVIPNREMTLAGASGNKTKES